MTTSGRTEAFGSYDEWIGRDVYDSMGEKVGRIEEIYYDDVSQRPEWVAVKTGLFGSKRSFAPIGGSTVYHDSDGDDHLQLPLSLEMIKGAPKIDMGDDDRLTAEEEQQLYRHYGYDWTDRQNTFGTRTERVDRDYQSGWRQEWQQKDRGDVVAEETVVNEKAVKERQPQTVRLRKYQWTEQVPVHREEVRMETGTAGVERGVEKERGGPAPEPVRPPIKD